MLAKAHLESLNLVPNHMSVSILDNLHAYLYF